MHRPTIKELLNFLAKKCPVGISHKNATEQAKNLCRDLTQTVLAAKSAKEKAIAPASIATHEPKSLDEDDLQTKPRGPL